MRVHGFLVLLALVVGSREAAAIPTMSKLDDVVKDSTVVVIASFIAPASPATATGYDLVVERTLRGSVAPGPFRVKALHGGHAFFPNGTRIVAFVDKTGALTHAATAIGGATLEDGVLRMNGFNDGDAHSVIPGILLLDALEALVVKGTALTWTFRGKILVSSPAGIALSTIDVTARVPSNAVTGMPAVAGFSAPQVSAGGSAGTDAAIVWRRSKDRLLVLFAEVKGKNPDGSIAVVWKPQRPRLPTEAELRAYLADPKAP